MKKSKLSASRARQILAAAQKTRVLVVGDVMLDQFIWGGVSRISPEAPVPVVDFRAGELHARRRGQRRAQSGFARTRRRNFSARSAMTTPAASCKNFWANKTSAAPDW